MPIFENVDIFSENIFSNVKISENLRNLSSRQLYIFNHDGAWIVGQK